MTDSPGINDLPPWFAALTRAESELTSARAENERLRAALEQVAMIQYARTAEQATDYFQHVAREALRPYQQKRADE